MGVRMCLYNNIYVLFEIVRQKMRGLVLYALFLFTDIGAL